MTSETFNERILVNISSMLWTYFGLGGLGNPWHDKAHFILPKSRDKLRVLYDKLDDYDISLESYCLLVGSLAQKSSYMSPLKLFFETKSLAWLKKFRTYCGSLELFDETAYLLLLFLQGQVENSGVAYINKSGVVAKDPASNYKNFCVLGYYSLADRIVQLKLAGVDPEVWLTSKMKKFFEFYPSEKMAYKSLVNTNALDPNLNELKALTNDPWRDIRSFLGLSSSCEIKDGYIPKGWRVSSDDRADSKSIVKITGDGFYYYSDGTQRKGRRHYLQNAYCVIKCFPDNFLKFKPEWDDPRLVSANPTYSEYLEYGASPGIWDDAGNSTSGRGRPIKWRKVK